MHRIAVIRLKGKVNIRKKVEDTMKMLRLFNKHTCIVLTNTKSNIGMISKIKDHATWGELDENTFKALLEKRAKLAGNKRLTESYIKEKLNLSLSDFVKEFFEFKKELKDIPGLKPFFKLSPPKMGFERAGIKKPFSLGGALGYRKNDINKLIMKMI